MTERSLRICLIATEYPGFGAYGGFGVLTRDIAVGLVARGLDVFVAMPRKSGQGPVERVDGLTILSYPSPLYVGLRKVWPYAGVYRAIDADVYHSQEPSLGTVVAARATPQRKHMVTFQDPRDLEDWRVEWGDNRSARRQWKFWINHSLEVVRAMRRLDAHYSQAKFIIEKTRKMYGLQVPATFLPNPLRMPEIKQPKAGSPVVCYLGRWDARKRPELFVELASKFPQVHFIFAGACLNDPVRDESIRSKCRALPNVEMTGWVGAEKRSEILSRSWILVNTSTRECLPVSYLEAAAHKCAILSHCNADDFSSVFGYWAQEGDLPDYVRGLDDLLADNAWRMRGEKGYEYVLSNHEYERVIDQHVEVYRKLAGR